MRRHYRRKFGLDEVSETVRSNPPIAQERVEQRPDGLVRITLKKAYSDGTVAVDMDPLSLLCRLATSVPLPRFHTIHYAGVLAAASPWRSRLKPPLSLTAEDVEPEKRVRKSGYRPWAELLQRTFSIDVLTCPSCQGRMRLIAVVKNPAGIARYLAAAGELIEVPGRSPPRAPPYWKSQVLRRQALGDQGQGGNDHDRDQREASPWGTRQRSERTGSSGIPPRLRSLAKLRESRVPRPLGGGFKRSQLLQD